MAGRWEQIHGNGMDRRFFHRLGASQLERTICSDAGGVGLIRVTGAKYGVPPEDFRHARYIIAWGANIHGNNIHLWPFVEEARRQGREAGGDRSVPDADGAGCGLASGDSSGDRRCAGAGDDAPHPSKRIWKTRRYVAEHTTGIEELRRRAAEYTPERVAEITGLGAEEIVRLAHEYATTTPGDDSAELRGAAGGERRHGGAGDQHAADDHGSVEAAWAAGWHCRSPGRSS